MICKFSAILRCFVLYALQCNIHIYANIGLWIVWTKFHSWQIITQTVFVQIASTQLFINQMAIFVMDCSR